MRETGVNGVLADEMGLGKTVQTIAFFALLRHRRKGARPRYEPSPLRSPEDIRVLWCISTVMCFAVLCACVCEHRDRDGGIHDGELPPWNVIVERTLDGVL